MAICDLSQEIEWTPAQRTAAAAAGMDVDALSEHGRPPFVRIWWGLPSPEDTDYVGPPPGYLPTSEFLDAVPARCLYIACEELLETHDPDELFDALVTRYVRAVGIAVHREMAALGAYLILDYFDSDGNYCDAADCDVFPEDVEQVAAGWQ